MDCGGTLVVFRLRWDCFLDCLDKEGWMDLVAGMFLCGLIMQAHCQRLAMGVDLWQLGSPTS